MKVFSIISVAVILMVALFLVVRIRKHATAEKTFKTTDEFIQYFAAEAVADAERENHIQLDYSIESIKQVEVILGKLHEQYAKDQSSVSARGLGLAYGAYVGEVIRRSEPGSSWERDHPAAGEKSYPLHWKSGESFPIGWCYKRITNGAEDNIWIKYVMLKERSQQKEAPIGQ